MACCLLGANEGETGWSAAHKTLAASLAAYFAQVIHNSNAFNHAADQIAVTPTPTAESPQISGRIITLEDERDQLQTELGEATPAWRRLNLRPPSPVNRREIWPIPWKS
ncbi:MAG: hypothetical protein M5U34_39270 [Chloroflexi bacterium]|nr:hypothetical protein [Chloroflexota bacterium]